MRIEAGTDDTTDVDIFVDTDVDTCVETSRRRGDDATTRQLSRR